MRLKHEGRPSQGRVSFAAMASAAAVSASLLVLLAGCGPGAVGAGREAAAARLIAPLRSPADASTVRSPSAGGPVVPLHRLPGVLSDCTAPPPMGQRVQVAPVSIVLACADNGLGVASLDWTTWTEIAATGTGVVWENDCKPDCAMGTVEYYPASITLSGVQASGPGRLVFSKLTAVYRGRGPAGHATDHFCLPLPAG